MPLCHTRCQAVMGLASEPGLMSLSLSVGVSTTVVVGVSSTSAESVLDDDVQLDNSISSIVAATN